VPVDVPGRADLHRFIDAFRDGMVVGLRRYRNLERPESRSLVHDARDLHGEPHGDQCERIPHPRPTEPHLRSRTPGRGRRGQWRPRPGAPARSPQVHLYPVGRTATRVPPAFSGPGTPGGAIAAVARPCEAALRTRDR
jgi:hypothetical protein